MTLGVAGPAQLSGRGTTAQFTATLTNGSGLKQDQTNAAQWLSSAPSIATVSSSGLVTAVAEGNAAIGAMFQGVGASAPISVTLPFVLTFNPESPAIDKYTLYLTPVGGQAATDEVGVTLRANQMERLRSFEAVLRWSPRVVDYVRYTEGDFMKQGGVAPFFSVSALGALVDVEVSRPSSAASGATGTGDVTHAVV